MTDLFTNHYMHLSFHVEKLPLGKPPYPFSDKETCPRSPAVKELSPVLNLVLTLMPVLMAE